MIDTTLAAPPRAMTAAEQGMAAVVRAAEGVNRGVGQAVAWLTLGTVLACFATVYTRYALGVNYIWLQEAYIWQHVAVIVLGGGYTMMTGGFVRVDVFYAKWSPRRRAAMDLAMTVAVLVPFLAIFAPVSWGFFLNSWNAGEGSKNPGGIPSLWLLKGTLLGFCGLIALQATAMAARCLLVLGGREEFVVQDGGHVSETAA